MLKDPWGGGCAGKGRVFKCLQENLAQPQFGQSCKEQVEQRGQIMQEDYRLDYGVSSACENDVEVSCFLEKVAARPRLCTAILCKCLST